MSQAKAHIITPARKRALTPSKRKHIESRIEELIAVLDAADGDCDLEENGDLEPSLGVGGGLENYDAEGDDADLEPSLGWSISGGLGDSNDLELGDGL